MPFANSYLDILLILVVSLQSTAVAYLHRPIWKAFMLTLPFPFTVASLSVGMPINDSHVLGLVLLLLFSHAVKILHYDVRMPILPSIGLSALIYCLLGWYINRVSSHTEITFWWSCACTAGIALIARARSRPQNEPGHRSLLPIWLKWIMITLVIIALLLIKKGLQGFMTVFPMVGVIAAYEARKSLRTIACQIPNVMLTILSLMVTAHVANRFVGLGASLAIGWISFLLTLAWLTPWSKMRQQNDNSCATKTVELSVPNS